MTNKERLIALLGFQADPNGLTAALLDIGLDGAAVYAADDYPDIRKAAIALMEVLLSTPNTSNSNSGYSITYDRSFVEARMNHLRKEAGLPLFGATPTIRGVSPW